MAGAEHATVRELRPASRVTWFAFRRRPLSPGPLEPLQPRRHPSFGGTGFGIVGLSLVLSLILAPQIRAGVTASKDESTITLPGEHEAAKPLVRRIDGATRSPIQSEAFVGPVQTVPDRQSDEASSRQAAVTETVMAQPAKPATPLALLEPLPVLELDETSFEAAPVASHETPPRQSLPSRGTP